MAIKRALSSSAACRYQEQVWLERWLFRSGRVDAAQVIGSSISMKNMPQHLQSHLYEAFLSGTTYDVLLRVTGNWDAVYKLHRIVLIQADFFRSLFTSGFKESTSHPKGAQGEVVVRFDHDPNVTRAAFEICLARLYGGGPLIHVCPTLKPSTKDPLCPAYVRPWESKPPVPAGQHPASPRFLLSLLSTAFYLSIPSLATEALELIFATISPLTVVRYLDYALGKGIGPATPEEPERARTLEHIGQDISSESNSNHILESDDNDEHSSDHGKQGEMTSTDEENSPSLLYGIASNKIGEACAAFLTRWGMDLLIHEEEQNSADVVSPVPRRLTTNVTRASFNGSSTSLAWKATYPNPRIWSKGLSAEWIRGVISSDEFFVKDELARYDCAKRVVELRRRMNGVVEADEIIWQRLFDDGIYYSHLPFDELRRLMTDHSPTTGRPYVSAACLHQAHWNYSDMQRRISKYSNYGPSFGGEQATQNQRLRLGLETTPETARRSHHESYWPVPIDTSLRIGDPGSTMQAESLFNYSPAESHRTATARNFFGIASNRLSREQLPDSPSARWVPCEPFRFSVEFWGVESLKEKMRLYSHTIWYAGSCYNVYTQAVRKKGLQLGVYLHRQSNSDAIPTPSSPRRASIYSQLGMSSAGVSETTIAAPIASRPHARSVPSPEPSTSRNHTPVPSRSPPHRSSTPLLISSPRSPSREIQASASFSPSSPPSAFNALPTQSSHGATINATPPNQPYRDPRPAISAYFSISCHSATGSSLTRFSSGPDTVSRPPVLLLPIEHF